MPIQFVSLLPQTVRVEVGQRHSVDADESVIPSVHWVPSWCSHSAATNSGGKRSVWVGYRMALRIPTNRCMVKVAD